MLLCLEFFIALFVIQISESYFHWISFEMGD